jgi:hypothetical protein
VTVLSPRPLLRGKGNKSIVRRSANGDSRFIRRGVAGQTARDGHDFIDTGSLLRFCGMLQRIVNPMAGATFTRYDASA